MTYIAHNTIITNNTIFHCILFWMHLLSWQSWKGGITFWRKYDEQGARAKELETTGEMVYMVVTHLSYMYLLCRSMTL